MISRAPRSRVADGDRLQVAGLGRREAESGRYRLEDHGGGALVHHVAEGAGVVEGDVDEPRGPVAERLEPPRIARGPAEPGQAVVGAERRDDLLASGVGPRKPHREVHRLRAGGREDRVGKHPVGARGELRAEAGAPAADQVVVADVEVVERLTEGLNRPRMSVSEVEHSAVAVTVPVPAPAVGIAEPCALALADDDVHAHRLQGIRLAAVDVGGERRRGLLATSVRLDACDRPGASSGFHFGLLREWRRGVGCLR